jgi:hypothetical protein
MTKEHFWFLLTGMAAPNSNKYRSLAIPHPILRCIQRALANTIFARGETVARANEEDLMLMDFMLRPNNQLERPDLTLFMVRHWLGLLQNKKTGGSIHISSYVTLIAERLNVSVAGFKLCKGTSIMDAKAYERATFIKIEHGPANHSDRYFWRLQTGALHLLPFPVHLSYDDESTWLFTGPPPEQVPAPEQVPHPSPVHGDVHMADAPPSHPQFQASSSHAGPSYPPPIADPSIGDVYRLVYDMRQEHGAILHDLDRRVGAIEEELRDWRWYDSLDD